MAWGGFGGGHVGGFGSSGSASSPGNGLPFAGIPSEMRAGVDKLLADEPAHTLARIPFTYRASPEDGHTLRLRDLLWMQRALTIKAAVLVVVVAIINQAGPKLIELGINEGMRGHGDMLTILVITLIFLLSIGLSGLFQAEQTRVTGRLAAKIMNDLRIRIFIHLQRLGLDFYTEEKAGVVMSRMTSDIENLQQLLQDGLASFIIQGLTMIVIATILIQTNAQLALLAIGVTVPPLFLMSLWFKRASEKGYIRVRDGIAKVLTNLSESLHGIRVMVAHNRQVSSVIEHRNIVGDYQQANNFTAQVNAIYSPISQLIGYCGQVVLLGVGGEMVLHKQLSLGALVAFFLYLNRFFAPIQLLVQQYNTYQQGQSSIIKLNSLLETAPSIEERRGAVALPDVEGDIRFEHVTFAYDPEFLVLEDVNLHILPGETVAFVGQTGAGKSTIAKLITRFYDPISGSITIDGHDLREVTVRSLRSQLGVVPQEPFLFNGTIRENIAFGVESAADEEVAEAARAVGLQEVIESLPNGIDTVVHERGQSLSSGERQLIALARAFLSKPRILVLDEATSNLDLAWESKIERALDVLLEARTAILVAHRLSTAKKADRIVVVDGGRIIETGSHSELIAVNGAYARMYGTWDRSHVS